MDKVKVLLICSLFVSNFAMGQVQLGQTLFEWYYASGSVDIDVSNDGSVFVLKNRNNSEIKVFELIEKQWKQKGQTISQIRGSGLAISGDGNMFVVNRSDRIEVYRWDGMQWIESVGFEIEDVNYHPGGVSVSNSGDRISVSRVDFYNSYFSIVEVFEWKDFRWQTLGEPIRGESSSIHNPAHHAELSSDGSTMIISHSNKIDTQNPFTGMAEVYEYSGTDWVKKGENIQDSLISSVGINASISNDGNVIATSGLDEIKVLKWNGQSWEIKGASIFTGRDSRCSIELDDLGNRLAFAQSSYTDYEDIAIGRIALMEFNGENWKSLGLYEQGEQSRDYFGISMAFSGNGEVIVAVSDPLPNTRLSYIKSFKYDGIPFTPICFISGTSDACDYERVAPRSQYYIKFTGYPMSQYYVDSSTTFLFPIRDSIIIRPIAPEFYSAIPLASVINSNKLEAYKAIAGAQVRDTFCLIPKNQSAVDVLIDIIILSPASPGFPITVLLKYSNVGTVTVSGNVEFYFDDQLQEIISTNPAYDELGANHVKWNYEDLLPLESREIELTFELNRPTDNPPLNGGDRLLYSAKVEPVDGDVNPQDNQTEATVEVTNSFDPNDKRCMQGDTISPESVGGALTYVIRFENLGTAEAIDVRIRDFIDTTALDISTFEMIDASHDGYMVQISEGNIIDFIFKGINLPFDDANNDGYVAFNMHTKKHLQLGDRVKNDAAIFFDFNYPVITNEMITLVADQPTSITPVNPQLGLSVYPNPASDMARVKANSGILRVDLIDIQGRQLRQEVYINGLDKTREIPVNGLSQGNYWLRVTTVEGVGSIPLMVK